MNQMTYKIEGDFIRVDQFLGKDWTSRKVKLDDPDVEELLSFVDAMRSVPELSIHKQFLQCRLETIYNNNYLIE